MRVQGILSWSLPLLLALGALSAQGQTPASVASYPNKPIRLVSPIPPGGAPDLVAQSSSNALE
jgi:tripartite-type tricarboxylate transporter receptor subunit TctC